MRFYSTIYNMCILLLLGLFCWRFEVSAAGQCTLPSITPLKVTTVSLRNDTGHWIATVKMDHDANQDVAGPFEVDLEHSIEKCTDSESVHIETTVRAPPTQAQRGNGYELLPGLGLYKFHKAADTWYNAEMTCVKEGAHLLVLNSENEFAIIKKKWDEYAVGGRYLQIGINDFDAEKTFVTVTGDLLNATGYTKWLPGEPNSGNTANCGAVDRNGYFEDSFCSNKFSFFCEK
ncbi:hemolymph lipopolysaccharide-binding protein-like [Periplaneta americana]|uniref:hemolymph lipopolysaccharide-binding protein-like n=1 Tax=Periplaneta americana TaxID=6978 RepID=UPI0037E8091C